MPVGAINVMAVRFCMTAASPVICTLMSVARRDSVLGTEIVESESPLTTVKVVVLHTVELAAAAQSN